MSVNTEVQKSGNETALSVIRKFSRRVQGTGLIKTVRNRRYFARDTSKIVKKKRALKLLKRRAEYKQLVKEGKIIEAPARRGSPVREQTPRLGEGTPIAR
ncbi:30S ribosomal protein S21 [Candidatus Kaiserbacteria bacterium]|nr:30S ribosomal protein S21 [Candidatus Kaiserbacteria bacterium]